MSRIASRLGVGVLVVDHELDRDLERHGVGLPALLALVDVVLELQGDRLAAVVALADLDRRQVAAGSASGLTAARIGSDQPLAAELALAAQVLDSLQLAALALPVADRVLDELERAGLAEVLDREDRLEDTLQTGRRRDRPGRCASAGSARRSASAPRSGSGSGSPCGSGRNRRACGLRAIRSWGR